MGWDANMGPCMMKSRLLSPRAHVMVDPVFGARGIIRDTCAAGHTDFIGASSPRRSLFQRLEREFAGPVFHRGEQCTLARRTEQSGRELAPGGATDENASCSASNHRAPPSASSACMPLSTTHSTYSGILSLAQLSGSSDQMRLRNGATQPPPHEAEPGAPQLGRNGST